MLKYLCNINILWKITGILFLVIAGIWCTGVVYYNLSPRGWSQKVITLAFMVIVSIITIFVIKGNSVLALDLTMLELLLIWYFCTLTPQQCFNNTSWQIPWKRNPIVFFESGNVVTIHNIRDFNYRTENDYDINYISSQFDLSKITGVDLAVSHWDDIESIAHTMLSFEFSDGRHLAFSIETRLPENSEQGFIPGLYKQYGLLIIIGTEDDLFKLRTNYRKEKLYLYRTNANARQARTILQSLLLSANRNIKYPQFYNSLTQNCTTTLIPMLRDINPSFIGDIRLMLNGYSDELLFDMGYLATQPGETFKQLKQRCLTNQYLNTQGEYSNIIRSGM